MNTINTRIAREKSERMIAVGLALRTGCWLRIREQGRGNGGEVNGLRVTAEMFEELKANKQIRPAERGSIEWWEWNKGGGMVLEDLSAIEVAMSNGCGLADDDISADKLLLDEKATLRRCLIGVAIAELRDSNGTAVGTVEVTQEGYYIHRFTKQMTRVNLGETFSWGQVNFIQHRISGTIPNAMTWQKAVRDMKKQNIR